MLGAEAVLVLCCTAAFVAFPTLGFRFRWSGSLPAEGNFLTVLPPFLNGCIVKDSCLGNRE
jgi:hypothetical protein